MALTTSASFVTSMFRLTGREEIREIAKLSGLEGFHQPRPVAATPAEQSDPYPANPGGIRVLL